MEKIRLLIWFIKCDRYNQTGLQMNAIYGYQKLNRMKFRLLTYGKRRLQDMVQNYMSEVLITA